MTHLTAARCEHSEFEEARTDRHRATGRLVPRTRDTPRKHALLEVLKSADGFLSAAEIHAGLRALLLPQGLRAGITTVYHQLRRLDDSGALDTLLGDDGETRYWLPRHTAHHHYLVCRACGKALEIVADPVEEWADALGATVGFRDVTHHFEMFGLCERCADPGSRKDPQGHPARRSSSPHQPEEPPGRGGDG